MLLTERGNNRSMNDSTRTLYQSFHDGVCGVFPVVSEPVFLAQKRGAAVATEASVWEATRKYVRAYMALISVVSISVVTLRDKDRSSTRQV